MPQDDGESCEAQLYRNIRGDPIALTAKSHDENLCVEFSVRNMQRNGTWEILLLGLATALSLLQMVFNVRQMLYVSSLALVYLLARVVLSVEQESLLIISSLGLQSTVAYKLGFKTIHFIPWDQVCSIFINEVVTGQKVIYVLTVKSSTASNENCLVPLFKKTLPRLNCLEKMYSNMQKMFC